MAISVALVTLVLLPFYVGTVNIFNPTLYIRIVFNQLTINYTKNPTTSMFIDSVTFNTLQI